MLTARDDVAGLLAGRRRAHGAELEALRGRPAHPVVAHCCFGADWEECQEILPVVGNLTT